MLISTGELAKLFNITKYTIRYYLEKEVLTYTRKEANGYYMFSEKDIYQLYQIIIFREIGMSITEIKKVLQLKSIIKELEKVEHSLACQIDYLQSLQFTVQNMNESIQTHKLDKIVFLEYPNRYLAKVPQNRVQSLGIDYSKDPIEGLEKIYYLANKKNSFDLFVQVNKYQSDVQFAAGTYISKTFIANSEEEFEVQIALFFDDPLLIYKETSTDNFLIFENIECSLARPKDMVYTIEVKI